MKLKVKANCQGILGTLSALRKQATTILIKERSAIEDSPDTIGTESYDP